MPGKTKTEALVKPTTTTNLAVRPSFITEGDVRGTENITVQDIRPPSLRIAQAGSPQVKRSESEYIEGLQEGLFFDSVTREIYGEGPLQLVIVNQLGHRNIEFAADGSVLDFSVADNDPRTEFTMAMKDGAEIRVKPRATKFYDYLILLLLPDGRQRMMTLSMKSTQLRKAKDLNTVLSAAKMPSFALQFELTSIPERKGSYSYYGWRFVPKGFVSEKVYTLASEIYNRMASKTVVLDTEIDDNPFQ